MSLPGFFAEASLRPTRNLYWAASASGRASGLLLPNLLSRPVGGFDPACYQQCVNESCQGLRNPYQCETNCLNGCSVIGGGGQHPPPPHCAKGQSHCEYECCNPDEVCCNGQCCSGGQVCTNDGCCDEISACYGACCPLGSWCNGTSACCCVGGEGPDGSCLGGCV